MARLRTIKPGFFLNETLAQLPFSGRLLFAGLWCIADREGRLLDRPKWIKAQVFPYDAVPVDGLLSKLDALGFIQRYEVDGERCIAIPQFKKHQNPHIREAPSTLPAPSAMSDKAVRAQEKHSASTVLGREKAQPSHVGSGEWGVGSGDLIHGESSAQCSMAETATREPDQRLLRVRALARPDPSIEPATPQTTLMRALAASLECDEPSTKSERRVWSEAIEEMLHADPPVAQAEVPRLVARWRALYSVPCTPKSVAGNLSKLRSGDVPAARPNGHRRESIGDQLDRVFKGAS